MHELIFIQNWLGVVGIWVHFTHEGAKSMCLNLSPLIILSNIDDVSILAADMLGVDYAFNFSSELLLPTEFDLPLHNEFFSWIISSQRNNAFCLHQVIRNVFNQFFLPIILRRDLFQHLVRNFAHEELDVDDVVLLSVQRQQKKRHNPTCSIPQPKNNHLFSRLVTKSLGQARAPLATCTNKHMNTWILDQATRTNQTWIATSGASH